MFKLSVILCTIITLAAFQILAQKNKTVNCNNSNNQNEVLKPLYSGKPNHIQLAEKSFSLAVGAGFNDTIDITSNEILDRLKAGAYSEDYDLIPGIIGEHFPAPWDKGPVFDFNGLYPLSKIPYGSITDTLSGWYRGLSHGYDPVKGYTWQGTYTTSVEWANSPLNSFSWNKAIELYKEGKKAEAYEVSGIFSTCWKTSRSRLM